MCLIDTVLNVNLSRKKTTRKSKKVMKPRLWNICWHRFSAWVTMFTKKFLIQLWMGAWYSYAKSVGVIYNCEMYQMENLGIFTQEV